MGHYIRCTQEASFHVRQARTSSTYAARRPRRHLGDPRGGTSRRAGPHGHRGGRRADGGPQAGTEARPRQRQGEAARGRSGRNLQDRHRGKARRTGPHGSARSLRTPNPRPARSDARPSRSPLATRARGVFRIHRGAAHRQQARRCGQNPRESRARRKRGP